MTGISGILRSIRTFSVITFRPLFGDLYCNFSTMISIANEIQVLTVKVHSVN